MIMDVSKGNRDVFNSFREEINLAYAAQYQNNLSLYVRLLMIFQEIALAAVKGKLTEEEVHNLNSQVD